MEAVGLASAIVSLVELVHITVKYFKDVKSPKERDELSKELSNLAIYMTTVNQLTPNGGGRRPLACDGAKVVGSFRATWRVTQ